MRPVWPNTFVVQLYSKRKTNLLQSKFTVQLYNIEALHVLLFFYCTTSEHSSFLDG